jgi:hypothetical protein
MMVVVGDDRVGSRDAERRTGVRKIDQIDAQGASGLDRGA